ncbi:MAG: YegS/Rv2252/BmrU family lipid kinase [Niabella sp.]
MPQKRKFIYIINPISGVSSKDGVQNLIAAETLRRGIPYDFVASVADGDYSFLKESIRKDGVTDIIIVGGDGTVNQVVGSLHDEDVNFGIIPKGSGNGLAFGAGIPKLPRKALQTVFNGEAEYMDGFMVNDRFACMLCGIGFDAQVAHDFSKQHERGLTTYVKQVFKNFLTARAYNFHIELRENVFETEAYFISIANSNQFGNNFTIAPKADLCDGLLDIVIVTHQSRFAMLYSTMRQVGGLNKLQAEESIDQTKGIIYFQTDKISILNNHGAPLHIDGEPEDTETKIDITVKPRCFKLLL